MRARNYWMIFIAAVVVVFLYRACQSLGGNKPIDFYAKVIDQDGKPLANVRVKVKIRHWTVIVPMPFGAHGSMIPVEKETGLDGLFDIHGFTGDAMDIEYVRKEGYELEPNTRRSSGYAAGSVASPVMFKMWRTDIHESLITGEKSFPVTPDGTTYFINLSAGSLTNSPTPNGDLKVWVKRPLEDPLPRRYSWSCGIEAAKGGILEETDRNSSLFMAPEQGYTNSFHHEVDALTNGWGDSTGERRFYIFSNGHYGRMTIRICAEYNSSTPALIRIQYAMNPTGSRVLR